jgi:hypothetical protein
MSDDLPDLLCTAWQRLQSLLQRDPDELARRLARRRTGIMLRPPRAWCLAVRASDQRIHPGVAACVPEDLAYPRSACSKNYLPYHQYGPHEVTIDSKLLRKLCRPVFIERPGLPCDEVARKLGCHPNSLRWAIHRGAFDVRFVKGLDGKIGKNVMVLHTDRALDPCSGVKFDHPDVLYGTTWKYLGDHVPDGIEQTIQRVPVYLDHARSPRRSRRGSEDRRFCAWRWICPGCRKTCRILFYPLPPVHGVTLMRETRKRARPEGDVDAIAEPLRTFACTRCHDISYFSRVNADAWNKLITHLSGGLLYGHDVPRPAWFKFARKRLFRPILNRAPSKRRQQVLRGLLAGLSYDMLAARLGVTKSTVNRHARELYRQHNVRGPAVLREKMSREAAAAAAR